MQSLRIISWNISFQGQTKQKIALSKKYINESKETDKAFLLLYPFYLMKEYINDLMYMGIISITWRGCLND